MDLSNEPMRKVLKEGQCGDAELRYRTIEKGTILPMWNKFEGMYRATFADDYKIVQLFIDGTLWMSDAPYEIQTSEPFMSRARGDVLIGGLGIGMVPQILAPYSRIRTITIVELNQDVIDLVSPQIAHEKINVIQGDIYEYLQRDDSRGRFNAVFVDIWSSTAEPLTEVEKAKRLAGPVLRRSGFVDCWLMDHFNKIRRKIPQAPTYKTADMGLHDPCLNCGKTVRYEFSGLCMDCADGLMLSELWVHREEKSRD